MAAASVAAAPQSPTTPSSATSPTNREAPPPLSLTVDSNHPSSSPFPSPSSSFVPPPMPGAHEFANVKPNAKIFRSKKTKGASDGDPRDKNVQELSPSQPADAPEKPAAEEAKLNRPVPLEKFKNSDTLAPPASDASSSSGSAATSPLTPKPNPILSGAPSQSSSSDLLKQLLAIEPEKSNPATPTQPKMPILPPMQIPIPAPPSPTSAFAPGSLMMRTPSLSSSRPAPQSPAASRRESRTMGTTSSRRSSRSARRRSSRYRSGASILSAAGDPAASTTPVLPSKLSVRGAIKVRDYAFEDEARHSGTGPDAPKVLKKLLRRYGPAPASSANSRRTSGISVTSDESASASRRSSGFAGWAGWRWTGWGFGAGRNSSGGASGNGGGAMPSQAELHLNFDDGGEDEGEADGDGEEEWWSGEDDGEEDGDGDLVPGMYRALYDFEPEGTAEMRLAEGQKVKVVGRGGGVGWAVALREGHDASDSDEGAWALVPESYLKLVKADE